LALGKIPKKTLDSNNVKLSIIGCSPIQRISSFAYETSYDINGIYVDPTRSLYKALGLIEAQNFKELRGKGEKSKESVSGFFKGMAWSIYKSLWHKSGNVYQLGGTLIVDNEKNLVLKKIDTSPEDHIGVEELLKEAGIYEKL